MRYFIGFLITIGLLILLIFMLVHGGSKPKTPAGKPLSSYASTDATAILTTDGIVNYQQDHEQLRIKVDRNNVTFEELKGYDGDVVKLQTYPNTQNAYQTFLLALNQAGFTQGNTDSSLKDERGRCPLGKRYIVEFQQGGNDLQRFWVTSCGGAKTFEGNINVTVTLFQNQVPDYSALTNNISL